MSDGRSPPKTVSRPLHAVVGGAIGAYVPQDHLSDVPPGLDIAGTSSVSGTITYDEYVDEDHGIVEHVTPVDHGMDDDDNNDHGTDPLASSVVDRVVSVYDTSESGSSVVDHDDHGNLLLDPLMRGVIPNTDICEELPDVGETQSESSARIVPEEEYVDDAASVSGLSMLQQDFPDLASHEQHDGTRLHSHDPQLGVATTSANPDGATHHATGRLYTQRRVVESYLKTYGPTPQSDADAPLHSHHIKTNPTAQDNANAHITQSHGHSDRVSMWRNRDALRAQLHLQLDQHAQDHSGTTSEFLLDESSQIDVADAPHHPIPDTVQPSTKPIHPSVQSRTHTKHAPQRVVPNDTNALPTESSARTAHTRNKDGAPAPHKPSASRRAPASAATSTTRPTPSKNAPSNASRHHTNTTLLAPDVSVVEPVEASSTTAPVRPKRTLKAILLWIIALIVGCGILIGIVFLIVWGGKHVFYFAIEFAQREPPTDLNEYDAWKKMRETERNAMTPSVPPVTTNHNTNIARDGVGVPSDGTMIVPQAATQQQHKHAEKSAPWKDWISDRILPRMPVDPARRGDTKLDTTRALEPSHDVSPEPDMAPSSTVDAIKLEYSRAYQLWQQYERIAQYQQSLFVERWAVYAAAIMDHRASRAHLESMTQKLIHALKTHAIRTHHEHVPQASSQTNDPSVMQFFWNTLGLPPMQPYDMSYTDAWPVHLNMITSKQDARELQHAQRMQALSSDCAFILRGDPRYSTLLHMLQDAVVDDVCMAPRTAKDMMDRVGLWFTAVSIPLESYVGPLERSRRIHDTLPRSISHKVVLPDEETLATSLVRAIGAEASTMTVPISTTSTEPTPSS